MNRWLAWAVLVAAASCSADRGCGGPSQGPVPAQALSWPRFVEAGPGIGLDAPTLSGSQERRAIPELNGQGIALLDYDGDGRLDVFQVNGSTVEGQLLGLHPPDRLYRNLGDGRFQDVTDSVGLAGNSWSMGASAADYDGDGDVDLYVTNVGPNALWRNNGDGTFSDVAAEAGLADDLFSSASAWGDLDGDGDLDLYVSNFCLFDPGKVPAATASGEPCQERGIPVGCGPETYPTEYDLLYLNQGDGRFRDASYEAGVSKAGGGYGFGVIMVDVDLDGDLDIFVANDVVSPNWLWINDGKARFTEEAGPRGVMLAGSGLNQACMGVAVFDLDGDGLPDLGVTNYWDEHNTLYRNRGQGRFEDVSAAAGWTPASRSYIGWGMGVFDFDHDGWLDLHAVNGHVYTQLDAWEPHRQRVLLMAGRPDGRFESAGPEQAGEALSRAYPARGSAYGDLDGDGDVDALIVRLNEPPALWLNRSGDGRPALTVRLAGDAPNTQGLGARVKVMAGGRVWWAFAAPHQSFCSSNDPCLHFGLAGAARADALEVHWPDGRVDRLHDLQPGEVTVRQGRGLAGWRPFEQGW